MFAKSKCRRQPSSFYNICKSLFLRLIFGLMWKYLFACVFFLNALHSVAQVYPPYTEEFQAERLAVNEAMHWKTAPQIRIDTLDGWREWAQNENFSFGKDRGSLPMIADLRSLHPQFRDKVIELVNLCRAKGIELAIVETFRTRAKQYEYKAMGRKYTRVPGGKSKHQYGIAVDVVPIVDSVAVWNNKGLWRAIGLVGERLGLRWGGRWRHLYDPGHFELPVGHAQLANAPLGHLPIKKNEGDYPCLEEDIRLLVRYWKSWDTEQATVAREGTSSRE